MNFASHSTHCRLNKFKRYARVLALLGIGSIAFGLVSGCAYSPDSPADSAQLATDELIERAMDPKRPVANRVAWARQLDPAGRGQLEQQLLADLPELWGLEWRGRLALLEVVGGPHAFSKLQQLSAAHDVPQSDRAQDAIAITLDRIKGRLPAQATPANAERPAAP